MPYVRMDKPKASNDRRNPRRRATPLVFILILGTFLTSPPTSAEAASPYGAKAVAIAASKKGSPYAYGATGPRRFDCSGLTLYAFRKAGRVLPRTADQQYEHTRHIPRHQRAPGDLVFFPSGATIGHVGIYAGHNKIWHAPRPGTRVRLERIWIKNARYTRPT
ncbi:C40 family peptidase [Streptomyces sp. APSN-46.1]|uniref:C40 family peptidase n=1 Tax=Streptomyces sp. APSN-46.1 TaxID=2929049 RepID=UPI001FB1CCB4|nr:C40 family peptidase [Streptomyces sp. APSN-46.1]MCJ1676539.1 C40 family peptidase [Streptomyces sp. APSN-46.1]